MQVGEQRRGRSQPDPREPAVRLARADLREAVGDDVPAPGVPEDVLLVRPAGRRRVLHVAHVGQRLDDGLHEQRVQLLGEQDVGLAVAQGVDDGLPALGPQRGHLLAALVALAPHVPRHGDDAAGARGEGDGGGEGVLEGGGGLLGLEVHDALALGGALVGADGAEGDELADLLLPGAVGLGVDGVPGLVASRVGEGDVDGGDLLEEVLEVDDLEEGLDVLEVLLPAQAVPQAVVVGLELVVRADLLALVGAVQLALGVLHDARVGVVLLGRQDPRAPQLAVKVALPLDHVGQRGRSVGLAVRVQDGQGASSKIRCII